MVQRTISPNEPQWSLEAVVDAVESPDDSVIVESHGEPKAAVISFARFQKLREIEKQEARDKALAHLRNIRKSNSSRNDDLTQEEVEILADRFAHEFVDDLAAEGKLRFERDRS